MNFCVVVPVYNHHQALPGVLEGIRDHGLPCLLVDDGSDSETASVLDDLAKPHDDVSVIHLSENRGKGAALTRGLEWADREGYTHAVAIDADGQHDPNDLPRFLEAARKQPGALVIGEPVFDESVPRARYYGRKISKVWVWIETLSFRIHDPLVGYRCYPVGRTLNVIRTYQPGLRMDFDPQVLVQFDWEYGEIINLPVDLTYSTVEESNFDVVMDNVRISRMHVKLFFGMLGRIPSLMRRIMT